MSKSLVPETATTNGHINRSAPFGSLSMMTTKEDSLPPNTIISNLVPESIHPCTLWACPIDANLDRSVLIQCPTCLQDVNPKCLLSCKPSNCAICIYCHLTNLSQKKYPRPGVSCMSCSAPYSKDQLDQLQLIYSAHKFQLKMKLQNFIELDTFANETLCSAERHRTNSRHDGLWNENRSWGDDPSDAMYTTCRSQLLQFQSTQMVAPSRNAALKDMDTYNSGEYNSDDTLYDLGPIPSMILYENRFNNTPYPGLPQLCNVNTPGHRETVAGGLLPHHQRHPQERGEWAIRQDYGIRIRGVSSEMENLDTLYDILSIGSPITYHQSHSNSDINESMPDLAHSTTVITRLMEIMQARFDSARMQLTAIQDLMDHI